MLPTLLVLLLTLHYTLSEAWSGVNGADLMAAQGAFGTDFYDRSIIRPKHRAYYRSGRSVIQIGPKGALASHEIRPIHSAPSLEQSTPPTSPTAANVTTINPSTHTTTLCTTTSATTTS